MDIFDVISLLGGLAMFLYGMRLMGDSLKGKLFRCDEARHRKSDEQSH